MTDIKEIGLDGIEKEFGKYSYAVFYELSSISLMDAASVSSLPEECYEARFFSEEGELHIFSTGSGMKAVEVKDDGKECIDVRYELEGKFRDRGQRLIIRKNLAYDEDGQSYVANTRLVGIE